MIEVIAKLSQGAYLAGEEIECSITLRNSAGTPAAAGEQNGDGAGDVDQQSLAWTSVQIYCHCWVSQSKVKIVEQPSLSQEERAMSNSKTSFAPCKADATSPLGSSSSSSTAIRPNSGSSGVQSAGSPRVVFSTKPIILFCDLKLQPGESKTFWYKETLPLSSPSSFRGQSVKYAYKLTIGTQRINSPIRLLKVPIRVLALQDFLNNSLLLHSNTNSNNGSLTSPTPSTSNSVISDSISTTISTASASSSPNPPYPGPVVPPVPVTGLDLLSINTDDSGHDTEERETPLDYALQMLNHITSQSNQKFYNVTNSRGHVVKFCMFKHAFKLGEDIVGSLDFSQSNVPCVQYAVTLQSYEEITPECRVKGDDQRPAINSFTKLHEVCLGFQKTHFVLPVPLHITPGFYTDLINHKWRLHFEFVTSINDLAKDMKPDDPDPDDMDGVIWTPPNTINIETMVWDLPIKIYPNLPSFISVGLQMQTEFKQKI